MPGRSPRSRPPWVGETIASVLEAIGHTPTVRLDRVCADMPGTVYAKLEYLNPGLSKKDRMALRIIDEAERNGALAPGQTVVELTSGNAGTGLAIVCAVPARNWSANSRPGSMRFATLSAAQEASSAAPWP